MLKKKKSQHGHKSRVASLMLCLATSTKEMFENFKYGLYEVFKDSYQNFAEEELSNKCKPAFWL
jgi:hypothetical protein